MQASLQISGDEEKARFGNAFAVYKTKKDVSLVPVFQHLSIFIDLKIVLLLLITDKDYQYLALPKMTPKLLKVH